MSGDWPPENTCLCRSCGGTGLIYDRDRDRRRFLTCDGCGGSGFEVFWVHVCKELESLIGEGNA